MMKKIRIIFIALFIVICICPIALKGISKQDTSFEKRTSSKLPSLKNEDGSFNKKIGTELETYLSEHFAFRAELVTANSLLYSKLFGVSPVEKIICGDNDWLFLEETSDDYVGSNLLSERGINNIMRTLSLMNAYCEANGAKFVLAIPPNKATVYSDEMPNRYIRSEKSNLTLLSEKLRNSDIAYADLYKALSEAGGTLYHKRDSHWNNTGALVGSRAILEKLGITPSADMTEFETRDDWHGDLDDMIYPTLGYLDRQYYYNTSDKFAYSGKDRTPSAYDVSTTSENGVDMNVLVFRDSFFNTALQFTAPEISKMRFLRYVPYNFNYIAEESFDAVVLEIVERNIVNLSLSMPLFPAMPTTASGSLTLLDSAESTLTVTKEESTGYTKVSGVIDRALLNADTEIYLLAEKDGKTKLFSAFCINENSRPDEADFDCGYTILLEDGYDSWTLSPVLKNNDELTKINPTRRQ